MLGLSRTPRRAELRAFGIVVSAGAGLSGIVVALLLGAPVPAAIIGTGALVAAAASWARPALVRPIYNQWDRVARLVGVASQRVVVVACYAITTAAGLWGSRVQWRKPTSGASGWEARRIVATGKSMEGPSHVPGLGDDWRGVASLLAWSRRSGNDWMLVLVPYVALLSALGARPSRSLGKDVYTLY